MLLSLFGISTDVFAEQQEPNEQTDLFEMSIEDLMEMPVVVSASRQARKINELSVPVSVVTSEDIHYSGLTNIPEILQFTPGVDVLRFNRYTYLVGVRGLHESISDRVLSLIDGRIADNTIYGGPEFTRIPIFLEDIERIEVVRGPGGAAWGANAFTGVINIITKKPEDTLGYFGSTTINEFGDTFTHLRWAEKKDKWSWRISAGYDDMETSDEAGAGRLEQAYSTPGFDTYVVRDFSRNWRFDNKVIYHVSDMTDVSFGAGYSHIESGNYEQVAYFPRKDNRDERLRTFVKIDHKFEDDSSGYLQWFGNFTKMNWPSLLIADSRENDIEAQLTFSPAKKHQMSIGGNFRWTRIKAGRDTDQQLLFRDEPFDERWAGLFVIDRWQASERLTFEGQFRGDWYSGTQTDWSGRLAALYALDEQKDHIFRVSTAKAFRTPLISLREAQMHTIPLGGGLYGINLHSPDDLDNEETWSVEAGYTGKLTRRITLFANTYYQRFERMIGYLGSYDVWGMYHVTPDNISDADSWGAEIELVIEGKTGKISAWYAYNDFEYDRPIRSLLPAQHKAGITGRLFLNNSWSFNTNYKFTDTTPGNPYNDINAAAFHRLDLTLAKKIANGNGELMFGISDLLNKTNDPLFETNNQTAHETPGRTFFARLQLKF